MTRRLAVAALVAAALLLGGCSAPRVRWAAPASGDARSQSAGTPLAEWKPCPELAKELLEHTPPNIDFACSKIKVPQDWATARGGKPADGKTFDISLVRVRSGSQVAADRIGSVVVNPGGPGGSGVDLAVYLSAALPTELMRRFDIVGFDPRGVGRSTPVHCFTDAEMDEYFGADPDPVSQAAFDAAVSLQRRMAQQCGTAYGDSLRLFSTKQAAQDIDAVRAAVGDSQLSYLGFSYGTLLGAVYAQLFPKNVRALVLDGAVDPTLTSVQSADSQAKGFERAFDNFSNWCRGSASQCPIAPDPRSVVMNAVQSARTSPLAGAGGRKAGPGWILTAVVSSLYNQSSWKQLANALDNLRKGNPGAMFTLADQYAERDPSGHYTNLFDANSAINCSDDDKTPSVDQLRQFQGQMRAKYPLFGPTIALNLICAQWPGKRDPYPTGPATGSAPILVVGTVGDPATPYEQAGALVKMLGVGKLLTWQGEGHTAYPRTKCVSDAVDRYLIDLKVPAEGTVCPAK